MKKRFLVIDGSSLMYRAFFALPLLSTSTGIFTNAVFGFSKMLGKLLEEYKPDFMAVALDKGRKTFRNAMYEAYKGTRKPTPAELSSQFALLQDYLQVAGIQVLEEENYEADDILGSLAKRAAAEGMEAYIVTGDRDALQLIGDNVSVLFTKKGISNIVCYDEAVFEAEYGLKPMQLIDVKGLMGDTSDNIPGVPGIGQKTAIKLLQDYVSVEGVYAHLEEISGKKLKENLTENKDKALLSKSLATIRADMALSVAPADCRITPQKSELLAFYHTMEMKVPVDPFFPYIEETSGEMAAENHGTATSFMGPKSIQTGGVKEALFQSVKKTGSVVFCAAFKGQVPEISIEKLCVASDEIAAIAEAEDIKELHPLIEDEEITKIVFDLKTLLHAGISIHKNVFSIDLAAYLLEPSAASYTAEELAATYLNGRAFDVNSQLQATALAETASIGLALYPILKEKLEVQGLEEIYRMIELPLVPVLAEMEENGIYLDPVALKAETAAVNQEVITIQKRIYDVAGEGFNPNSPKQMREFLFDRLGIIPPPGTPKTKSGYSTNAEVLESIRNAHPIIDEILSYRFWTKLKSTYLDSMPALISPSTHRIHTRLNQTVTATGRLSSSEPNLQNIPVRTEAGRKIRSLFKPGEGYDCLLSADYSQIELRILAHLSEDENFLYAFTHEEDIHARTAAEVFGVPMEEVTGELRRRAKAVNFGIIYGISDFGLSRDLQIPRSDAARYIESYFAKCKGVKNFIDRIVEEAHQKGYVTTLFGRRRDLPSIHSKNFNQRSLAERMAMNTPIQGAAADIIKLAMIKVSAEMKKHAFKSRILLQVHDELVIEAIDSEVEAVTEVVRKAMETVAELRVPLKVDVHIGKDWAEAK
ncbi:DNA polymerase I [Selenomonas sp. TAMA-11512]|uniref:DNA polymerase I n=1 Tax=Selenomonas sp. TAMA-11512 TaxID=3095337 RepID=UPI003093B78E|nr:DNA polymerase I [Selenomonas sp. TAMA-11512]